MIHKIGERYTTIRIRATTTRVERSNLESISPNASNKSPSNPPGPVTYESSEFALANGATSARNSSTIAGRTGLSFGKTFAIAFPSKGIFPRIAFPSADGKAVIC